MIVNTTKLSVLQLHTTSYNYWIIINHIYIMKCNGIWGTSIQKQWAIIKVPLEKVTLKIIMWKTFLYQLTRYRIINIPWNYSKFNNCVLLSYRVFTRLLWQTGGFSLLDTMHCNKLYFTNCTFASFPALTSATKLKASHCWHNKSSMDTILEYKGGHWDHLPSASTVHFISQVLQGLATFTND